MTTARMKVNFCNVIMLLLFTFGFNICVLANTDSLLTVLNKAKTDSARVEELVQLHQATRFNKDSSFYFIKEAIAVAENSKDIKLITKCVMALAWHYSSTTKNKDSALVVSRNVLERIKKANYKVGEAWVYKIMSLVFAESKLDSSVYYAIKAMKLYKEEKNIRGENSIKINIAGVYNNMKKYREAIAVSMEALTYSIEVKNYHYAGTACVNIGNSYLSLNQYDSAIIYMHKSYEYNKLREDPYGEAYALAQIGHIYLKQKKYKEAYPFFKQAVDNGIKINSDEIKYMGHGGLIQIAAANNEWNKVVSFDNEDLKKSFLHEPDELKIYELLALAYEKKGNYEKAYENYKQYIELQSKITDKERLQKADELEAIYQNKEKQNKIELLNKEKEIEAAEKNKQVLIRNGIIVLSLVLIALGALLFNRFKLNKKIEQQQALLNERKRISTELHDDLGAQLSTTRMLIGNLKSKNETKNDAVIIEKSIGMLEDSIYKLRTIMSDLENTTLEKDGYLKATEELINKISSLQNIKFNLSHTGLDERLNKNTEHHLFRITQELVNNTLKYANAKKISVDIVRNNNCVTFLYEDDGAGFDTGNATTGKGLRNIAHRAGSLNAQMELDSSPGNGMRLNLQFNII